MKAVVYYDIEGNPNSIAIDDGRRQMILDASDTPMITISYIAKWLNGGALDKIAAYVREKRDEPKPDDPDQPELPATYLDRINQLQDDVKAGYTVVMPKYLPDRTFAETRLEAQCLARIAKGKFHDPYAGERGRSLP
jgi:hypothetical protein